MIDLTKYLPWQRSNGKLRKIKYIIVHHDAVWRPAVYSSKKRYNGQAWYHISKGYGHISYHYKIDNVGDIFKCVPEDEVCYHAGELEVNKSSLSVCLDGYLEKRQDLTSQQKTSLVKLLRELEVKYPGVQIMGHKDVNNLTLCPGNNTLKFLEGIDSIQNIKKTLWDKVLEIQKIINKL